MTSTLSHIAKGTADELFISTVGGCGEFGLNLTIYRYKKSTFVVDAGLMFADDAQLGVDSIIPDLSEILGEIGPVTAYIITHGHEDHIGALPYLIPDYPAPIYATPWAARLIRRKLDRHDLLDSSELHEVSNMDIVGVEDLTFQWLPVSHSLPMCCSLLIKSPSGSALHTGDFKMDGSGTPEGSTNLESWRLTPGDVDVILCDSTNAYRPGRCESEGSVKDALHELIRKTPGRLFFTTFSSNLWRLKTVLDIAKEERIPIVVAGAGLRYAASLGGDFHYLNMSEYDVFEEDSPRVAYLDRVIFLVTGSQGEVRSSLARISRNEHRHIKIEEGDNVIFSCRMIPGSEKRVYFMMADLQKLGANIITARQYPDIHVSGHACRDDIKDLINHVKPKNFLAVHGTHTQLLANQNIGLECGCPNSIAAEDGVIYRLAGGKLQALDKLDTPRLFVDGPNGIPMAKSKLRERLRIGESGLAIVTGVVKLDGLLVTQSVSVDLHGLGTPSGYEESRFSDHLKDVIIKSAERHNNQHLDDETLEETIRIACRRFLSSKYGKKPVVVVKLHET